MRLLRDRKFHSKGEGFRVGFSPSFGGARVARDIDISGGIGNEAGSCIVVPVRCLDPRPAEERGELSLAIERTKARQDRVILR